MSPPRLAPALLTALLAGESAAQSPAERPAARHQFQGDAQHTGRSPYRAPRAAPAVRWRFRARHRVYASPVLDAQDRLVVGSVEGGLHVVDTTGVERWARLDEHPLFSTAGVLGDLVVVGRDGGRYDAFDARGTLRWTLATTENADASPTVGPDDTLYLAHAGVSAVDLQGHVRWSAATRGHLYGAVGLTRDGATVIAADVTGEVLFLRARDGHLERRVTLPSGTWGSPLVLDDGAVVLGGRDGHLRCVAPDGTTRWDFTTRDEIHATPALTPSGLVVVGSDDAGIYALRATDGALQWRVATVSRVRASALVDPDGFLVVGSEDDQLYGIDAAGHVAWTVLLGADIDSSALLLPTGELAVGCDDGGVYLLGPARAGS